MDKLKIGISSCLVGERCNPNAETNMDPVLTELLSDSRIELVHFCPTQKILDAPRPKARIIGGDGFDVLKGSAKVVDATGLDVTEEYIQAAHHCLNHFKENEISFAVMGEKSPSCAREILYNDFGWPKNGYKKGMGVTSALLIMHEINVIGEYDKILLAQTIKDYLSDYEYDESLPSIYDHPDVKDLYEPVIFQGQEIPGHWSRSRKYLIEKFETHSKLIRPLPSAPEFQWKLYEDQFKAFIIKNFIKKNRFKSQAQGRVFLRYVLSIIRD